MFTDTPGFAQRKFTQFQTYGILKKCFEHIFQMRTTRRVWQKSTAGRKHMQNDGHAAAAQVPLCWDLTLNWRSMYIHTYLTICTLISGLITFVGSSRK